MAASLLAAPERREQKGEQQRRDDFRNILSIPLMLQSRDFTVSIVDPKVGLWNWKPLSSGDLSNFKAC